VIAAFHAEASPAGVKKATIARRGRKCKVGPAKRSMPMGKPIEFFFDVVSPASYLAFTQLPKLAEETGSSIALRPFFLPGLFKLAGSASPISVPAKGKWILEDFTRFARRYGVPFRTNRRFPLNSVTMMRAIIAQTGKPEMERLAAGFFDAMWASNRDVADPAVLVRIAGDAGVPAADFEASIVDAGVKQALIDSTAEAHARGAFGAPTFFVGGEMHWGQDRLDFVAQAARAA
jgi:2-hydroxychromene-2-carboxylate isomerase